jgi:type VI secretion system secreted protein Hcp
MNNGLESTGANRRDVLKGAAGLAVATAVATTAVLSNTQQAAAASTFTASIDGIGEFGILAYSWGASNSGATQQTGNVNVQDISMTKYMDTLSPPIFGALVTSTRLARANVTVVDNLGNTTRYDLEDVLVTSISNGGSGGEDRLTENITLAYKKLTFSFGAASAVWP